MSDLIEALQIFLKYKDVEFPTHCSHDELAVCDIHRDDVSIADIDRLSELSFSWNEGEGYFYSFRFGSC